MISGSYLCLSLLLVFGIIASLSGPNLFNVLFVMLPSLIPSTSCRLRHSYTCGTVIHVAQLCSNVLYMCVDNSYY